MYIIAQKCKELILKYNVDYIICENSFFGTNANTGIKLARLLGSVSYVAIEMKKEIELLSPSQARRILTGDGKTNKEQIANYIRMNHIDLGEYCNKTVKSKGLEKNSDKYDSLCISLAFLRKYKLDKKYKINSNK